jgi:hypothetical protein
VQHLGVAELVERDGSHDCLLNVGWQVGLFGVAHLISPLGLAVIGCLERQAGSLLKTGAGLARSVHSTTPAISAAGSALYSTMESMGQNEDETL